jgi:TolA-binding protein
MNSTLLFVNSPTQQQSRVPHPTTIMCALAPTRAASSVSQHGFAIEQCSELTPAQLKDTGDIFLQHHQLCIENTQLREQLRATQAELKSLREDFNAMRAQMQTLSGEEQAVRRP